MFAKVIVFTFVAAVLCGEHEYDLRNHHEPAHEYRQRYVHVPIRAHEEQEGSQEVQYSATPEGHGHGYAFSSQSIKHHLPHAGQEESQESQNEHVAPVYQYVQEEEEPARHEAPAQHEVPAQHYQAVHFAPAQVEQDVSQHAPQRHHAQAQYVHGHESPSYHYGANAYEGFSFHNGAQLHKTLHHTAPVHHATPVHHEVPAHHDAHAHDSHDEPIDYYAYPKYQFEYKVEDPHTGDNKFQHEFRDGDVVKGVYSLQEANGAIRTVEYSSDKHTGFNAIVKHSAPGHHVQIASHHDN